ncbi:MAG: hypothetical protein IJ993_03635 [Akkermansia sp.]|nr:hypothetical protein [Akkermansia sp.]
MRTFVFTSFLAVSYSVSSATAAGVGEIIPSLSEYPADGVDVAKVEAAFDELCTLQVRIVEVLETVKDKETADAAAEELFFIIGRVHELRPDYKKLEHCDTQTRTRLTKKLLQESAAVGPRKKAAAQSLLKHDFYGSEDLKDALRQMM